RLELARREVDRHADVRVIRELGLEVHRVAAGRLQDPEPERDDQAGLLGERDEVERRDEAALRVLPADERLEAVDRAGLQRDERLVVERELAVLERPRKVALELQALEERL